MKLFDRFGDRARRAIYWALAEARSDASPRIEPEHIVRGLLREDPELFRVLGPDTSSLLDDLRADLTYEPEAPATDPRADVGLSAEAKWIVVSANTVRNRLEQDSVATQHLLLGVLEAEGERPGWFRVRREKIDTRAKRVLLNHGFRSDEIWPKLENGYVTPQTRVLDDAVVALNARLAAIAELLMAKGVFSRAEWSALLDENCGPLGADTSMVALVDALVRKGIVSQADRDALVGGKADDSSSGT